MSSKALTVTDLGETLTTIASTSYAGYGSVWLKVSVQHGDEPLVQYRLSWQVDGGVDDWLWSDDLAMLIDRYNGIVERLEEVAA